MITAARTGPNAALRFGADEPLDKRGRADCARLRLPYPDPVRIAPERAAIETAALIGADGPLEPRLAAIDLGCWADLGPQQIDPTELGTWLAEPDFASHGGESVNAFVARLDDWLIGCAESDLTAVVASGTAQGLVAAALGCEFWSVEVAPAHIVNLSRRNARWRVRFGN